MGFKYFRFEGRDYAQTLETTVRTVLRRLGERQRESLLDAGFWVCYRRRLGWEWAFVFAGNPIRGKPLMIANVEVA